MLNNLKLWKGIKVVELRSIPIICGACGAKVSINGRIEDEELVFEDCPSCGAQVSGQLFMAGEEAHPSPLVSAEVIWRLAGAQMPECKMIFGDIASAPNIILNVLTGGVSYYAHPGLPQSEIYKLLASFIAQNLMLLKDLPALIQIINARLNVQPDMSGQSPLYSAENGGHSGNTKILKLKKEDIT